MNTLFLLMAEYNAAPIVPLEEIREKYFGIATKLEANRRANNHALPVPAFKLGGQRSGFYVHIADLAEFIDKNAEKARVARDKTNNIKQDM